LLAQSSFGGQLPVSLRLIHFNFLFFYIRLHETLTLKKISELSGVNFISKITFKLDKILLVEESQATPFIKKVCTRGPRKKSPGVFFEPNQKSSDT
jgi:hypothetical protein